MIYIVRSGTTEFVKIGYAAVVEKRLALIQIGNPHPLVLLREMEGGRAEEALMHARFHAQRYRAEWFKFVPEMLTAEVLHGPPGHKVAVRIASPRFSEEHRRRIRVGLYLARERQRVAAYEAYKASGHDARWLSEPAPPPPDMLPSEAVA